MHFLKDQSFNTVMISYGETFILNAKIINLSTKMMDLSVEKNIIYKAHEAKKERKNKEENDNSDKEPGQW